MIASLQVYRGFAAVLVIFYHAHLIMGGYATQNALTELFRFAHSGVLFFFVLSGFIIYYVHRGDIGKPTRLKRYGAKRFVRIYPVYWIVTLLFLPVWFLVPSFGQEYHRELSALVMSLLLAPQEHMPHVSVGWTLVHEVAFYLLFAVAVLHRRIGFALLAGWQLSILFFMAAGTPPSHYLLSFLCSEYNLLFGMGMLAAYIAIQRGAFVERYGLYAFILGNILFLAAAAAENGYAPLEESTLWFGAASFLMILGAPSPRVEGWFHPRRMLVYLGDASYSVYLVHYFILSFLCKAFGVLGVFAVLPGAVIYLLLCAGGLLGGVLFYRFVEAPLLERLRGKLPN